MARSKELTPAIRERICELYAIGWGYKRIHGRYPYIPLSTIRYTIIKEKERREGVSKARSGRIKKLTEAEKDRLLNAIHGDPKVTAEDLLKEVDYKVKYRSIQRLLNAENLRKWRCSWRPYLKEEHALKRLRWAFQYRHFTPEDWARVFLVRRMHRGARYWRTPRMDLYTSSRSAERRTMSRITAPRKAS